MYVCTLHAVVTHLCMLRKFSFKGGKLTGEAAPPTPKMWGRPRATI
eukprot:gene4101-1884_t